MPTTATTTLYGVRSTQVASFIMHLYSIQVLSYRTRHDSFFILNIESETKFNVDEINMKCILLVPGCRGNKKNLMRDLSLVYDPSISSCSSPFTFSSRPTGKTFELE